MLDVLGHIAALEVLRSRLGRDVSSGALGDQQAVDALEALTKHYPFAVLGSVVDHLLAHAGPSDVEVALLEDATSLYADVREFLDDFRVIREQLEQLALDPNASAALDDYNAARAGLADLIDRYDPLRAALQAYAWRLQPLHHLVQQPLAFDAPVQDWPWRDVLISRRTGAFAASVLQQARNHGTAEALAFGVGVLAGYAGNVTGSPYLVHGVSGPRRSHPYRDRVAAYAVGAWTRAAPPAVALDFDPERFVPIFGSPQAPQLPGWLTALLKSALDDTYDGSVSAGLPDLDAAYAQLVAHWRLLHAFPPLPPPEPVPLVLDEMIVNTLSPADLHPLGPPGTNPPTGPAPTTSGSSAPSIFDPGPGQPPWFRPSHDDVSDYIAEACLDILFLPVFLIRVGAWLWHKGESHEPSPSTPVGSIKAKLETPVGQEDFDDAVAGKGLLISVDTLLQMDVCLHRVTTDCLRVMKVLGLLYPEPDELPDLEFRQFVVLPDEEAGFVWPARPPATTSGYIQPPGPPVERPHKRPSGFAPGEKPIAFLVPGVGGAASMEVEGFDLVLAELLESGDSPVRVVNRNLDADRGVDAECWTPGPGTSIDDDPVNVVVLGYGDI
jgi:hypothetical protein